MTLPVLPFVVAAVLVAAGVTLMLERSLVRVLGGIVLLGNGVNLLIVTAGSRAGEPPILGLFPSGAMADALPQAMVLTSIVITLGITAFLLAMVHRTWQVSGTDEVQDDTEDRNVRLRARRSELRDALRERQEAYRRLIEDERAALRQMAVEAAERERREESELEQRILDVNVDLGQWMEANRHAGLSPEELMARFEQARREEESSQADQRERVNRLRAEFARDRREQAAKERALRKKLRARFRETRRQMRAAIRAERERQALALDPDLEGDD